MSFIPSKFILLSGIILVLTAGLSAQVVHRFTGDRFSHYAFDDWISYGPALTITSVDMDDNYIYFATAGGGILRYEKYENIWDYPFTTSNGLRSNNIKRVIYSSKDNFLYAVTPMGLDVYKPAERVWYPAMQMTVPSPVQPQPGGAEGTGSDKNFRFPPYSRPANSSLPNFFTDIKLTYHPEGIIYDQYNRDFKTTDRIVDSWQRLWMGTNGLGPLQGDLFNWRLESIPQSLPYILPRDILLWHTQIWIGGLRTGRGIGGITLWDTENDHWQYYEAQLIPQLYKDDVSAIDGNNQFVVFATSDGVAIFDQQKDKWITLNTMAGLEGDRVKDVLVIGDTAYVGSEFGFNWIDLNSTHVYESKRTVLDHVAVNQVAYKDSLIWAATQYGLYSIDIENDRIVNHPTHAAISDYDLTAIEAVADEIWMANKNGIFYWNQRSDEWRSFSNFDASYMIRDIAYTDECLWFATNKGVLKYDRPRNYWRIYTENDGLICSDTYHIDPQDDYLWITTSEGISQFRWWRKNRID